MKKIDKREIVNLLFSAFLVIGYVICAYFFCTLVSAGGNSTVTNIVYALAFAVFGLLLFYATRVGDGKQVKRFSLPTLIIMDLPALYIVFASLAQGMPFYNELSAMPVISMLAAVTLGYGIPYTFLSGYEMPEDSSNKEISPFKETQEKTVEEKTDNSTEEPTSTVSEELKSQNDIDQDTLDRVDDIISNKNPE